MPPYNQHRPEVTSTEQSLVICNMMGLWCGPDLLVFDFNHVFLDSIPFVSGLVKQCLETVHENHQGREVVIIQESSSMGILPLDHGAPLPKGYKKLPKIINFHSIFNFMLSKDVFPIGPGLPPPTTDEGRARVAAMNAGTNAFFQAACDYAKAVLKPLGATKDMGDVCTALMTAGDITIFEKHLNMYRVGLICSILDKI